MVWELIAPAHFEQRVRLPLLTRRPEPLRWESLHFSLTFEPSFCSNPDHARGFGFALLRELNPAPSLLVHPFWGD